MPAKLVPPWTHFWMPISSAVSVWRAPALNTTQALARIEQEIPQTEVRDLVEFIQRDLPFLARLLIFTLLRGLPVLDGDVSDRIP